MQKKKTIDLGLRLNILYHLFQGESPTNVIDHLPDDQLDSLYQFMWEKTIDIGIRAYGPDFSHEKLLGQLQHISLDESDIPYSNSGAIRYFASDKVMIEKTQLKQQIEIMAQIIIKYVSSSN